MFTYSSQNVKKKTIFYDTIILYIFRKGGAIMHSEKKTYMEAEIRIIEVNELDIMTESTTVNDNDPYEGEWD